MPSNGSRLAAAGGALLLATGAAALWISADQSRADPATVAAAAEAPALPALAEPEPEAVGYVPVERKSKEEQRFARADRDDDGRITRAEYLTQRRRNFDKLDANGNGRLEFEEYAASGIEKFRSADSNGDGLLLAAEFATTAPPPRSTASSCRCPDQPNGQQVGGRADEQG